MAEITGSVTVTGIIAPTDTNDSYPVIDPRYGVDGLRNVDSIPDRDAIPEGRRRLGMLVGVGVTGATGSYYKLINEPGTTGTTDSDWEIFDNGALGFESGGTGGATGARSINIVGGNNVTVQLEEDPSQVAKYTVNIPTLISGGTA